MPEIFLSYRRDDAAGYAGRLHQSLEERLGRGRVFRDVDTLEPGQDFVTAIEARVAQCIVFLALIGKEWLEASDAAGRPRLHDPNDYVRRETAAALRRPELLVIPVLVEGVSMPPATALPPELQPLARRHAVSLRDETWDHDVERLVAAISPAIERAGGGAGQPKAPDRRAAGRWAAAAAVVGALVVLLAAVTVFARRSSYDGNASAGGARMQAGVTYRLDLPVEVEAEIDNRIYTLLWATLTPQGRENMLRLRFRFSNEAPIPAAFSPSSFQLEVDGVRLAPRPAQDVVANGYSIEQAALIFDVPAGAQRALLHIIEAGGSADIELDLRPAAQLSAADTADAGHALSRALVTPLSDALPDTLHRSRTAEYVLTSAAVRRFVNHLRVVFGLRVTNHTNRTLRVGPDDYELVVDGQRFEPADAEADSVAAGASTSMNVMFRVPVDARALVFRVLRPVRIERPFQLSPR